MQSTQWGHAVHHGKDVVWYLSDGNLVAGKDPCGQVWKTVKGPQTVASLSVQPSQSTTSRLEAVAVSSQKPSCPCLEGL